MKKDRASGARWAIAALAGLVLISLWLAVSPAVRGSLIVLASAGGSPDWLLGVLRAGGSATLAGGHAGVTYYLALVVATVLWALVVWQAPRLPERWLLGCALGLIAVFTLAPPLLSQDVFSYIAYARLEVVHALNPYSYRPFDIPHDAVFGFAGSKDASDVYGPFFTLFTLPLAWLSVPAAFWVLKALAGACTAGLLMLVRSLATRLGAGRARAIALLGLSPATLVHVVGGAHNESLTMLVVFAGIAIALARPGGERWPAGGFVSTLATGVKASAAIPLPFMLAAARRRLATFWAMLAAGLIVIATAFGAFGSDAVGALNLISSNQDRSSRWSIPHKTVDGLDAVFGTINRAAATDSVRLVFVLLLVLLVAYLLRRSWRLPQTWLANAGWATLGVLLASAWLVPWYMLWLLPFAALSRDRRLQIASIALTAYSLVIAIPF